MNFTDAVRQKRIAAETAYKHSKPPEEWEIAEMEEAVDAAVARGMEEAHIACQGWSSIKERLAVFLEAK